MENEKSWFRNRNVKNQGRVRKREKRVKEKETVNERIKEEK